MLREACFCIRNLSLPAQNKMLIVQQGAIEALLVVLKTHEKNRDVTGAAIAAIRELTINAESAVIIAQNNGAKYLFAVMKRHPDLKEVIQEILCFVRIAWTIKYTCIGVRQNTLQQQAAQQLATAGNASALDAKGKQITPPGTNQNGRK